MHALAERGDVSSALRDFERYRETMCSVERSPGPELTALATAIAAGRHRLSMIPAHPLPNAEDPEPNAVQSIAAASAPPPVVMPRSGMSRPLRIGSGALVVAVVVLLARSAASNGNVAARAPARSAAVAGCRDRAGRATLVAETRHRGTILEVGQRFTKGWTLKNTGECAWTPDFRLHFVRQEGEPLTSARGDRPLGVTVAPGQRATLDVPMRAPSEPGLAREAWALLDASGAPVVIDEFEQLVVAIRARRRLSPACRPGQEHAELAGTSHSDNQVLSMGESFEGSWSILNDGDCAWPAHMRLRRSRESAGALSGDPSHVESAEVVQPGAVTTFRVAMLAPNTPGRYREDWEVVDNNGRIIPVGGGRSMMLRVVVVPAADLASQIRPPTCRSTDAQAGFVSETPRDSTRVAPGARFEKVWTIANTGDCRWEPPLGVRFLRSSGERMSLVSAVPLRGSVMPRQTYSFVVPMRAPTNTGLHTETWELVNEHGAPLRVSASSTIWAIIMSRP